jgi:hypothetical protein
MHKFPAKGLVHGFARKAAAGNKHDETHQRSSAEGHRQILAALGTAELAEQVVSDVIVQDCVLRCGGSRRGCGIPAEDLCLLALRAAGKGPRPRA